MIFPPVKESRITGSLCFDGDIKIGIKKADKTEDKAIKTVFGELYDCADVLLTCEKDDSLIIHGDEAYGISSEEKDGRLEIIISSSGEKSFIRALFAIKRMLLKNEFILGSIIDYPSFAVRGYIEGFYGKPWKSDERLEMLSLMALWGENTHYYAPKDDPYHRDRWNELYPEEASLQLRALVERANSLCMDFYYCIAPGLSMCYSSEEDFSALKNKTKQLFSMGIRGFGLLLDDIPADLYYDEDKKRFGNAANAHVELTKKYFAFLRELSSDCRLTVCPTAYHGKGNEKELTDYAANVHPEVDVFFTGCDICSKEITSAEADVFCENTSHKPLYWDNYPVNDAEMFMEMHIGPVIGREKTLASHCTGLISNCMEYFSCNKIPLITVASYLWNSEEYDPEAAYSEAVKAVLPEDEREDFIHLADQFRTSCLKDENSRIMGEYLSSAAMAKYAGDKEGFIRILIDYTDRISLAAKRLKSRTSPIYGELSRWIKKFCLMSEILEIALDVVNGADRKEELSEKMSEYNESATVLTAFCFREYIESVLADEN